MDELDLGNTIKGFIPGQKVLNRYKLERILGRGGMGVVWLARDEELERDVALKFLPEIVALDKDAVKELKRETRRSLELTHSNIIRIYDFLQDARTAAISMEYVAGDTLASRRSDLPNGFYEPAEISHWVEQLCAALEHAHAKAQIVHRDLKPANLMIDARGDLKVADFGIAASVSDSVSRISAQGGSSGTPVYMSPQQMMGEKPAVTDDIYALGATLFDLLTGKPPFYSGNIIAQVQAKVPPSIGARRKEFGTQDDPVPESWEQTVAACLAKDADARPQSAAEVAERLGLGVKGNAQRPTSNAQRPKPAGMSLADAQKEARLDPKTLAPAQGSAMGSTRSAPKTPLYAGLAAGALLLGGLGWYFGYHVPEQKRLLAEKTAAETAARERQGNEERRAEEKRTLAGQAEEKSQQEREERELSGLLSAIATLPDEASQADFDKVAQTVADYLRTGPSRHSSRVGPQWEEKRVSWQRYHDARRPGSILVKTQPSEAMVEINGIRQPSPALFTGINPGEVRVKAQLTGYETATAVAQVLPGATVDLPIIVMRRLVGTLRLEADLAGARVELRSGDFLQSGGVPGVFEGIPAGTYQATYSLPNGGQKVESITVTSGQTTVQQVRFKTGSIKVTATVPDATVSLDGVPQGMAPFDLRQLAPGRYLVAVQAKDHLPFEQLVEVSDSRQSEISAALTLHPRVALLRALVTSSWRTKDGLISVQIDFPSEAEMVYWIKDKIMPDQHIPAKVQSVFENERAVVVVFEKGLGMKGKAYRMTLVSDSELRMSLADGRGAAIFGKEHAPFFRAAKQ